ncbi:MAG: hypothetical protein Q9208_007619 [Pyrenodesmia sp. 3 TL-2023]
MSELKGSMMMLKTPGGKGPPVKFTYKEMELMMATMPVDIIHFPDENGEIREDSITFTEVKTLSSTTLDALFEAWTQLKSIMTHHGPTLNKRWLKRTINQRKETLSKAWPGMPAMHRPDFEVLRKEQEGKTVTFARDSALRFPHINAQDLSQPKPLLLMFNSRSLNPPSTFTNADRDSIRVGIKSKMLVPKYLRGYAMYLNGEQTRETYGRLVSWKHDRRALLKCHHCIAPDPGMGLLILEIQRDVLQFLVRCGVAILHDMSLTDLIKPSSDSSGPQKTPCLEGNTLKILATEQESLTAHALEAPYRAPDAYDFARLGSLVDAKCQEANDHFLLLREDPGYFAELMHEECGHTLEAILNRHYDPRATRLSQASWNGAISRCCMNAYHDAFMWEAVSSLFNHLIATYTKQKAAIQPGQALPDAYVKAFSRLGYFLDCVIVGYLGALPEYMSAVPTFKKLITNKPYGEKYESYMEKKPGDYLYWLFTELVMSKDDKKKRICGLANILQEMETVITKDQEQKERLTWRLVKLISDVAVITEIQRHLDLSAVNDYQLSAFGDEENKSWMETRMASLLKIKDVFQEGTGLAAFVMDLRVFDYPSEKSRTAVNTAKMRSAEQALDLFWEKLNQHFVRKTGKTLKELEANKIQYRDMQRTPVWTDPRPCVKESKEDGKNMENLDVSVALRALEERTESTIDPSEPSTVRQKVKTRGSLVDDAQAEDHGPTPVTNQDSTAVESPRLSVKKKAFNTFAALFGKPLADKLPGELPWTDFKKAMVNVGFGAEKLQGSGWLFESDRRSIIFHEPHPESKLPMQWARRIARRLNRNFGWTADSFVLEDGKENGDGSLDAS